MPLVSSSSSRLFYSRQTDTFITQAFKNDDTYFVAAFDKKKNLPATRQTSDEAYLENCERDRRSIYIGDLPPSTDEESLMAMFYECGEIIKINIISRPMNSNGNSGFAMGVKTLAFIEFAQSDMPELAISKFNGADFKGVKIRVERKTVKDRSGPTPRGSSRTFSSARRGNMGQNTDSPASIGGSGGRQPSFSRGNQQGGQGAGQTGETPRQTPMRGGGNRALTINTQITPRNPVAGSVMPSPGYNAMGYPYPPPLPSPYGPGFYGAPGGQETQNPWAYYNQYWPPTPVAPPLGMDPMALYNAHMLPFMMASQQVAAGGPIAGQAPAPGAGPGPQVAVTPTASADDGEDDGGATPTRANPGAGARDDPTPRKG